MKFNREQAEFVAKVIKETFGGEAHLRSVLSFGLDSGSQIDHVVVEWSGIQMTKLKDIEDYMIQPERILPIIQKKFEELK